MESAVLGSILADPHAIIDALELTDSDFSNRENASVFAKIKEHHEKGLPIDGIVIEHLVQYKDYFTTDIASYVRLIKEGARIRSIVSTCTNVIRKSRDSTSDQLLKELDSLGKESTEDGTKKVDAVAVRVIDKIDKIRLNEQTLGINVGLDFDKGLGGFEAGKFYVIAARPAMGKSAFALEIASRAAQQGVPVGFMSLEMDADQLTMRLIANKANIDSQNLREGRLSEERMHEVIGHANEVAELPIVFDDNSYLTAGALRARAHSMHRRHKIGMLVIDYLQLITGESDSRQQDVAEASRMCKIISKELGVPVIALSQLNRGVEARPNKRPLLSDLRESGAIEQDADAVMMLYRPEYYEKYRYGEGDPDAWSGDDTKNICEVIIVKNRDGETGIIRQVFLKEVMQFKNRARI